MAEVLVEAECVTTTQEGIDYYEAGRTYTIDVNWAKRRGLWGYFRPLRELAPREAEERIYDEILPAREKAAAAAAEANEESEAKLAPRKRR